MTAARKSTYPGKVAIRHAIESARDMGLDVSGFTVGRDGVIKIIGKADAEAKPQDEWEQWFNAQKQA